jgi:Cellulose binding domain
LLLLEYADGDLPPGVYLNSGIVPNDSRLFSPGLPSVAAGPPDGRRAIRTSMVRDRRAFALALSAAGVSVAAAAIFGSIAPLHSTSITGGQHGAAGGLPPQASTPWSAAPLGSPSGQATLPTPSSPATARPPRHTRKMATPGHAPTPRASPPASVGPPASTGTATSAGTRSSTRTKTSPAARSSSGPARSGPKVVVRYLVDSQGVGGFQGQVQVVNDGTQPIAGWQIVVALPDDTLTAVQNAGGFVSNGILLLQPVDAAEVVPPGGGTLNVFFVAEGTETIPAACTFNGIDCS